MVTIQIAAIPDSRELETENIRFTKKGELETPFFKKRGIKNPGFQKDGHPELAVFYEFHSPTTR